MNADPTDAWKALEKSRKDSQINLKVPVYPSTVYEPPLTWIINLVLALNPWFHHIAASLILVSVHLELWVWFEIFVTFVQYVNFGWHCIVYIGVKKSLDYNVRLHALARLCSSWWQICFCKGLKESASVTIQFMIALLSCVRAITLDALWRILGQQPLWRHTVTKD